MGRNYSYYFMVLYSEAQLSQLCPMKGDLANSFSTLSYIKMDLHCGAPMRDQTAASLHASS